MKLCKCGRKFEPFKPKNSTIRQSMCTECLVKKGREKQEKQARKEWTQEKKAIKEKLKRLPEYKVEARKVFQLYARLRDGSLPCVSCDRTEAVQWDGGHFLKAEIYSGLIFHEDNVHKQCSYCNDYLAGNYAEYRQRLIKRIGIDRVVWLEENKDRLRNYKYSKEELLEIKRTYQQKIKQLNQNSKNKIA